MKKSQTKPDLGSVAPLSPVPNSFQGASVSAGSRPALFGKNEASLTVSLTVRLTVSQLGAAAASWNGPQHSSLQTCSVSAWWSLSLRFFLSRQNKLLEHAVEPEAAGFVSSAPTSSLLQLQA